MVFARAEVLVLGAAVCLALTDFGTGSALAAYPASQPDEIPTVVVTASKRPRDVRDLPESIDVLDSVTLERTGNTGLRDLIPFIPGVSLTELQQDQYRISIRGIQLDSGGNVPAEAGVFVDDIPLNDPFLNQPRPDLSLFDLDALEILKGPQGTLYGGSALSGALRFRLADADPSAFGAKSFIEYGVVRDGSPNKSIGAAVNIPVGRGDAALRLVANRRLEGGTVDDLRNDVDDTNRVAATAVRGIFRWDVADGITARVKALRQDTHASDVPFTETESGDDPERSRALRSGSPTDSEFTLYSLNFDVRTRIGDLASITSRVQKSAFAANAFGERAFGLEQDGDPYSIPTESDVQQTTQEIRLSSPGDSKAVWTWLVGAYFQDYQGDTVQQITTEPTETDEIIELLDFRADIDAREYALFGEVSRMLSPRWQATVGLRTYAIETRGDVVTQGAFVADPGINRNDADFKRDGLNPKISLRWLVSQDASIYATIARGFRFGGIQITGPSADAPDAPRTYSPDSLWSYEIGSRTQWLAGRLQADGAFYFIDWDKPQVQTNTGGDVPLNVTDNVGGAESYGAELAVRWLTPLTGLSLSLSSGYTHAETTRAFLAPGGGTVDKGTRLPGYADYQAAAQISYERAIWTVPAEVQVQHRRMGGGDAELAGPIEIYNYGVTDLRVGIHPRSRSRVGRPSLELGILNLTDERALVAATYFGPGNFTSIHNLPRMVAMRLDWTF